MKPANPFEPSLHGVAPDDPILMRGLGDLVEKFAQPIGAALDHSFGTHFGGCEGCAGRKDWLNNAFPFRRRKPKPFRIYEPRSECAIVYPWLSTAAVWDELRFSLRSIHANWADRECPIYIIGNAPPPWLIPGGRVEFIEIPEYQKSNEAGLFKAFQVGMQIAREVAWFNDDIYLIRPCGFDQIRTALTEGDLMGSEFELRAGGSVWYRALADMVAEMKSLGCEHAWRFATHTPYLFEIEKSREIFRTYYLHHKGSWVSLYHNHHGTPHTPCWPFKVESLPTKSQTALFLNHRHLGPDTATKRHLQQRFSSPAPWEARLDF